MDYGSVCSLYFSEYQHDLACFSSKEVIDSYKGADDKLARRSLNPVLKDGPEESLERKFLESPISEEQAQDGRDSYTRNHRFRLPVDINKQSGKNCMEKLTVK